MLAVTLASVILAIVMTGVAWRVIADERRRSEARVRALAAEIESDGSFEAPVPFHGVADRPPPERLTGAAIAAGVLLVAGASALAVLLGLGPPRGPVSVASTAARAVTPLELVALGHERQGDRLTVRGVVRNPTGAAAVDGLTAIVFVFGREGGFVASGRGTVQTPALGPGQESSFVIALAGVTDVGRYRVSFRTDDRVVPHVDRRESVKEEER